MKSVPNLISPKTNCCGCGVCASVCPVGAISMVEDAEGFLYPKIDQKKCIRCQMCIKSCIFKLRKWNTNSNREKDSIDKSEYIQNLK